MVWSARGEETYFLQSNYFEEPKELYLRINKLQALDKDEATLVIDTEKGEILNGPKDGRLQILRFFEVGNASCHAGQGRRFFAHL